MSKKIVKTNLKATVELNGEDIELTLVKVHKKVKKEIKEKRNKEFAKINQATNLAREIKMLVEDGQSINLKLEMEKEVKKRLALIEKHDKIRSKLKKLHAKKDELDNVEIDFDEIEKDGVLASVSKESKENAIKIADTTGWMPLKQIIKEFWDDEKGNG